LDANNRLRIATRIHFALMRHLGADMVDVGRMLKSESEAREVLWVCDASGDAELMSLARRFRRAEAAEAAAAKAKGPTGGGHAPQDTPWARDTSGFGLSQPAEAADAAPRRGGKGNSVSAGWLKPVSWLRRDRGPR
jgi:hypothetical protein